MKFYGGSQTDAGSSRAPVQTITISGIAG